MRGIVRCVVAVLAVATVSGCQSCEESAPDAGPGADADAASTDVPDSGDTESPVDAGDSGRPVDADVEDTGDGGDALTAVEAYRQYVVLRNKLYCEAAFTCSEKVSRSNAPRISRFGTAANCKENLGIRFRIPINARGIRSDLRNGFVRFDRAAASDCLRALRNEVQSAGCEEYFSGTSLSSCDRMFQGTQKKGDPCRIGRQCETGRCDQTALSDKCYGMCDPSPTYVGAGQSCTKVGQTQCERSKNLRCSEKSSVCKEVGVKSRDDSCTESFQCKSGLVCTNGTCGSFTYAGEGDACGPRNPRCEIGLVCKVSVSGSGSNETVSRSCSRPLEEGDSCYGSPSCRAPLYCDGATFAPSKPKDSTPGTCKSPKPNGEPCERAFECQSYLCSEGTCRDPSEAGSISCELPGAK